MPEKNTPETHYHLLPKEGKWVAWEQRFKKNFSPYGILYFLNVELSKHIISKIKR